MKYWIIIIALITLVSRLLWLDSVPPHLSNDEISIAYDAYSLIRTGKDEHGNIFPISFQSHGTYKAPLYGYTLAPLTLFLENSEVTARIPSAIAGCLTVLVTAGIFWELTRSKNVSVFGAMIIAINPWHIYTSRMALESNLALFYLCLGIWLFLKNKYWISVVILAISMYGYHTEWLLAPILLFGLIWFKSNKISIKKVMGILVIFGIICLPLGWDFISKLKTSARANTEMIWKNPGIEKQLIDPNISVVEKGSIIFKGFESNYFDYLDPGYLFFYGLGIIPGPYQLQLGLFLSPMLVLFIHGLFAGTKKILPTQRRFFWFWLATAPIVPAMTQGGNNLVRYLPAVVPYTLLITLGLVRLWEKKLLWVNFLMLLILGISFGYFCLIYYKHFPILAGENYQYGYKQGAEFIKSKYNDYERIIVDPRFGRGNRFVGVPHLYIAYFTNLEPTRLLNRIDLNGLYFDKYQIREIDWKEETVLHGSLYLVPISNLPDKEILTEKLKINLPNGNEAFVILTRD